MLRDATPLLVPSPCRRPPPQEFHPRNDSVVISGDKKGNVALWDYDKVHERTVHDRVHSYVVNAVRVLPWSGGGLGSLEAVTASSDGISRLLDLETGESRVILELNPNGYQNVSAASVTLLLRACCR